MVSIFVRKGKCEKEGAITEEGVTRRKVRRGGGSYEEEDAKEGVSILRSLNGALFSVLLKSKTFDEFRDLLELRNFG